MLPIYNTLSKSKPLTIMNRTREQLKAAKARKEWLRVQKEKEVREKAVLKKVKTVLNEDSLRDSA